MCGSPYNIIVSMGQQWLKRKGQSEVATWRQWKNVTGTLCNSYARRAGQFHRENVRKTIKKCVPNNLITREGCQWPKRKQQSGVSFWKQSRNVTGTLCNSYTRKGEQFHGENGWNKNGKNVW